jgi:hypothetical protein
MYAPTSLRPPRSGPTSGESGDGLTDFDGAGEILRAWGNGLRPDPDLTVSEWADRHRMLSGRASAEPGRYRTVRTPYMREIMDRLSPGDPTQRIVFMKAAQVGATEAGNNWIGFAIHQAPGPMLAVQPTVELAKRNSRQRIDPLIDESPELRERVKPARSRDAGNTMLSKEFAGGILIMTGANSAVGLRSTPARYIFLDEVDAYPASADEEGDPVGLAEARSLTFAHRRKVFLVSTPTIRGLSRIEREYEASDQRRFFVPRPRFKSFVELNAWLEDRCRAYARANKHPEMRDKTIWQVFEDERPSLVPYVGPFDGFHAVPASVSKTCLVRFDNNRYSVDARAVGRPVEIRAYADRLECWQDGRIVGQHARAFGRGKTIYDPLHYIPVLARKPGALRNGAPFKEWDLPVALRRVQRKLERQPGGDRQTVEILAAVLTDGIEAVEAACAEALSHNVHSASVVLNILARHREPPPPLTITTPDALKLACEPTADCDRYDSLRRQTDGTF